MFKSVRYFILCISASAILISCSQSSGKPDSRYEQKINDWHQERIKSLTSENGWLSLAGLYWLNPGQNSFGSDSSNKIIFPGEAPAHMGQFSLENGEVNVSIEPNVVVKHKGKNVTSMPLENDHEGKPTILTYQSLHWYVIKRGDRYGIRLKDSQNSAIKNFKGIERFPVSPKWNIKARYVRYDSPKTIEVPNILGMVSEKSIPGYLEFEMSGKTYHLDPLTESGSDQFFIVFGDKTNGDETYGGGRFLYVDKPNSQKITHLDFNKAYNPPCAFTGFATCPLPPSNNRLSTEITAGEKKYGEAHTF